MLNRQECYRLIFLINTHQSLQQNISKIFFVIEYSDTSKASHTMSRWDLSQRYKDHSTTANQRNTPNEQNEG